MRHLLHTKSFDKQLQSTIILSSYYETETQILNDDESGEYESAFLTSLALNVCCYEQKLAASVNKKTRSTASKKKSNRNLGCPN